jgi:hypothetical protein
MFSVLNKWCLHTLLSSRERKKALQARGGHWRTWACYGDHGKLIAMDLKTFGQLELRTLLQQAGFQLLGTQAIHIASLIIPLHLQYGQMNAWGRLFVFLGWIDRLISRIPFIRTFGYTKMIVARRLQTL